MSSVLKLAINLFVFCMAACWKVGEPAPYVHLARAFDLVEHESGRLKTGEMLCNMFRR